MMLPRLKYLLAGTLRRQLIVGMTVVMAITMSVFVWDQTRRQQSVLFEQQTDQAMVLAHSVATSAAVWVISRDYGGLRDIVDSLKQYPDARHIIVLDVRGRVLAHSDPSRLGLYLHDLPPTAKATVLQHGLSQVDVASPVVLSGQHIGWVRIGLGTQALNTKLAETRERGILVGLTGIVLSLILAALTGQYLTRRLHAIQRVADAVQAGDSGARAKVTGDDEAAQLARQFNHMLDSLAQRKAALLMSESRLRATFDTALDAVVGMDVQGHIVEWNKSAETIFGWSKREAIGQALHDLIIPVQHRQAHQRGLANFLQAGEERFINHNIEITALRRSGEEFPIELSITALKNHDLLQFTAFIADISQRKQAEERLQLAASVFTHAREGIIISGLDGTIIDVNEAFTRITGYPREEVLGQNPRIMNSGRQSKAFYVNFWEQLTRKGHWYGEIWNRRKNGELYAEMLTITAVRDADQRATHYVGLFFDITAAKEQQQKLDHIAHYDALTNLPNRVLLADRLRQGMLQEQRRGKKLAVVFLDLDGFKSVNDNHGHETGDQLLIALATRMKQCLREGDTLARIGGDEFVAVLGDLDDVNASVPMLIRLLNVAAQPTLINGELLQISASLGVTYYPQTQEVEADQLLRQADQAMYQAKQSGKNRYNFFDTEQDSGIRSQHESIERIRQALTNGEFILHYQPKVNLRTGEVIGCEALIRWQHPQDGLRSPALFLPIIENHPLSIELGEWVIANALAQMARWQVQGLNLPVSVNVGARQLQQSNFVFRLQEILAAHPTVRPSSLEIEILETSALEDLARVSQVIEDCRELGVSFAMDDFGTGYSSLTYLRRLRVNLLKIDQSFVSGMLNDVDDLAILQGIIGLARSFRREVIAEGVETVAHGTLLLQLGCEQAQGYGIAKPMPAQELPDWIAHWTPDASWGRQSPIAADKLSLLYAQIEHRNWITSLQSHLQGERPLPPPLEHDQCHFGQWLRQEGRRQFGTLPQFATIEQLHHQIHALGKELAQLQTQGQQARALARLGELEALRDTLLQQLDQLVKISQST